MLIANSVKLHHWNNFEHIETICSVVRWSVYVPSREIFTMLGTCLGPQDNYFQSWWHLFRICPAPVNTSTVWIRICYCWRQLLMLQWLVWNSAYRFFSSNRSVAMTVKCLSISNTHWHHENRRKQRVLFKFVGSINRVVFYLVAGCISWQCAESTRRWHHWMAWSQGPCYVRTTFQNDSASSNCASHLVKSVRIIWLTNLCCSFSPRPSSAATSPLPSPADSFISATDVPLSSRTHEGQNPSCVGNEIKIIQQQQMHFTQDICFPIAQVDWIQNWKQLEEFQVISSSVCLPT